MSTLTAYRPTDSLMTSLARAGWGDLTGRQLQGVRSTLRALVDLLPHGSGQGEATAAQIADAAGLSERWTRRCLHVLEDAGLISWQRGGVAYGRPQPSAFRVVKTALVALIKGARPVLAVLQAQRAERTAQRLAGLTFVKSRGRRLRRSAHAELSASPHPQGGESHPRVGVVTPIPLDPHNPSDCIHGLPAHLTTRTGQPRCADCRHMTAARPR